MSARGTLTTWLWWCFWLAAAVLLGCEALDAWRREAPLLVWVLKLGPLLVVLPGALRDQLRGMIWVSFVCLLYFLLAVQRIFAEPQSLRALIELCAVVTLFLCAMFYVRYRARELRSRSPEEPA